MVITSVLAVGCMRHPEKATNYSDGYSTWLNWASKDASRYLRFFFSRIRVNGETSYFWVWLFPARLTSAYRKTLSLYGGSPRAVDFRTTAPAFSVLDAPSLSRAWIVDIIAGNPHSCNAPQAWSSWINTGKPPTLLATRSLEYRTKFEQIPEDSRERLILKKIHEYFQDDFHGFERCASALVKLLLPDIAEIDLTRPSRDGGRDATGKLRIGAGASGILVDFAIEAKCYNSSTGVGVKDMSRLISRLRHRQFGILVTTSYVNLQAYKEIKEDQHPIIVISGADIVSLLRDDGYSDPESVLSWLKQYISLDN